MTDSTAASSLFSRKAYFVLTSIASFLLYALGVLMLHQDRARGWTIEASGPIPSAISYLAYGTPLGAVDSNVLMAFALRKDSSVQEILTTAASGSIPHGSLYMYTLDGIGAGSNLFATFAMWLFGTNLAAFIWFYLFFVGISVLVYALRFQDNRLFAIPLYCMTVTVMLLTPLSASPAGADQMAIGGNRYFVLAAILPTLHIFFEIIEQSEPSRFMYRTTNLLLLFVQGILLLGALLVRSSTGYVIGVLLVVIIFRVIRERKKHGQLIALFQKSGILAAAFGFWVLIVTNVLPAYVLTGRVFGVFWHRSFMIMSLHPDWPFGGLREKYDCTRYIPEGLNRNTFDRNGNCVWWAYPPNANHPSPQVNLGIYSGEYERVLRNAFFYVVFHYPKQVFQLYLVTKSLLIKDTLTRSLSYLFQLDREPAGYGLLVIGAAQIALVTCLVISTVLSGIRILDRRMAIFPTLFACSLVPLYVAYAGPWSSTDTICLMYCCLALAGICIVQFLKFKTMWPQLERLTKLIRSD